MSFLQIPIGTNPNTFLGYEALRSVVITPGSGILNTAFGFNALKSLVSGSRNTAIGNIALRDNQTGDDNTAVGNQVMRIANNAFGNVGVGHQAFYSLTTGSFNVGIGWLSLFGLTTGGNNTAIGQGSGRAITTGSDNSILGGFSGNQGGLDIRTLSNYIVLSDGAGNPRLWIDNTGAANIPGGLALTGSLSITGGTVTANNPVLSATQTWNNAAVTFTGWQLNVTDTASAAASLLMDLQVGGVSRFNLRKDGLVRTNGIGAINSSAYINFPAGEAIDFDRGTGPNQPFARLSCIGGAARFAISVAGTIGWTSGAASAADDLVILRDAANTLAQRNGVNAQTLRVYNTFTDASNYERVALQWVSNELQISAERAGTGLARSMFISASANLYLACGNTNEIRFYNASTISWRIDSSNMFYPGADNSYDIGVSGGNRPRNLILGSYAQMSEMTAPAAPAANSVRIYAEDNGSGKTRLMALFATGAAQQIAIEP